MRTTATTLCVLFVTLGFWADDARAQIDAEIPYTSTPPTIDGMGSDFDPVWDGVIEHGPEEFNTVLGEEPEDLADLSVTWKALWDEDNLYVLVEVVDVEIYNTVDCNWDDDSIELYIDAQELDSEDYTFDMNLPDGVPAYQFTAVAGDIAGGPYCRAPPTENDETAFTLGVNSYDDGGDPDSTRYPQGADISNGSQQGDVFYAFEVAFPWEALEETPENILARGSFGFGVAVNDDDTDGPMQTQVMWASERDDLWQRSDIFPSVALLPPDNHVDCDFDGNGACDGVDIDQLMNDAETGGISTDLNGDGVVNDMDRDEWLALAGPENGFGGPLLVGDTNLDGINDASDLNAVALSWQNTGVFNYTNGNITSQGGPGVIVNDLNGLALSWQQTAAAAAANAVPEPATPCWLVLGLLCLRRRSWQRRR